MAIVEAAPDRHIIEPDTPILNGVFLGRVAIVVDHDQQPDLLEGVYRHVSSGLSAEDIAHRPLAVGRLLNFYSFQAAPSASAGLGTYLAAKAAQQGTDWIDAATRFSLTELAAGGYPNCHVQTLIVGGVAELLQQRRGLPGSLSIDRQDAGLKAHTWVRHVVDGTPHIYDPNRNIATSLEGDAMLRESKKYLRAEDIAARSLRGRILGSLRRTG